MDKEIKEENDYYFKKNIELSQLNTSLRKQRDDLQQRINKAVEYIKDKQELNKMFKTITLSKDSQNELLNILKGDDTKLKGGSDENN